METIKLALPVITFVLGILVTLYIKRWDYKRESLKRHVDEICSLSEEWYNRLVELSTLVHIEDDQQKLYENLSKYSNGSLFYAKYRQSLKVLKRYKRCRELVSEAEEFITLLTEPISTNKTFDLSRYACKPPVVVEKMYPDRNLMRQLFLLPANAKASRNPQWHRSIPAFEGNRKIAQKYSSGGGIDLSNPMVLLDLYERVQRIRVMAVEIYL